MTLVGTQELSGRDWFAMLAASSSIVDAAFGNDDDVLDLAPDETVRLIDDEVLEESPDEAFDTVVQSGFDASHPP